VLCAASKKRSVHRRKGCGDQTLAKDDKRSFVEA
jgi:hypothetical protein